MPRMERNRREDLLCEIGKEKLREAKRRTREAQDGYSRYCHIVRH
jgi:hypothetical protein